MPITGKKIYNLKPMINYDSDCEHSSGTRIQYNNLKLFALKFPYN